MPVREKYIRIQGGILAVLQFCKILLNCGKFGVTVSLNTKVNKAWVKFCDCIPVAPSLDGTMLSNSVVLWISVVKLVK